MTRETGTNENEGPSDQLQGRITYFETQAQRLMEIYPTKFLDFVRNHKSLVRRGDRDMKAFNTTGYDIFLTDEDFPVQSEEPLIFYSNYLGRSRHFGMVLALIEQEGIINEGQVVFGVKASKVLYDGWPRRRHEEQLSPMIRRTIKGEEPIEVKDQVSKGVQVVLILRPEAKPEREISLEDNAVEIESF